MIKLLFLIFMKMIKLLFLTQLANIIVYLKYILMNPKAYYPNKYIAKNYSGIILLLIKY